METDLMKMNDHDLIIVLISEVKSLRLEIAEMKDSTKERVTDHETRIRRLEQWSFLAIGGAYVLQFVLKFLIK